MITYMLTKINSGYINDIHVESSQMLDEVFSIGVTLDGVRRLTDYEIVRLAETNDYFRKTLYHLGINIEDGSVWEIDGSRGVSKEITKALKDNAGVFFVRELNLLHCLNANIAEQIGVKRRPYKIAGLLADKCYKDDEIQSFRKYLNNFCERLETKGVSKIRHKHPRSFNTRKYSVSDINQRLSELYIDAAANRLSGSRAHDLTSRRAVLELTYQPVSEYLNESLTDGNEICNGYVYYTRKGETVYYTHNNTVLSASVKYNIDKIGCVEILEGGEATVLIPGQDFDAHCIYKTHNEASLTIGTENVSSELSKSLLAARKEIASLKSSAESLCATIDNRDMEIMKLKKDMIEAKNSAAKKETVYIYKDREFAKSESFAKRAVDAIGDTKAIVLGAVAIVGGAYTLHSYFSKD